MCCTVHRKMSTTSRPRHANGQTNELTFYFFIISTHCIQLLSQKFSQIFTKNCLMNYEYFKKQHPGKWAACLKFFRHHQHLTWLYNRARIEGKLCQQHKKKVRKFFMKILSIQWCSWKMFFLTSIVSHCCHIDSEKSIIKYIGSKNAYWKILSGFQFNELIEQLNCEVFTLTSIVNKLGILTRS